MAHMTVRQALLRLFLAAEVIIFFLMYVFGSHGIAGIRALQRQTTVLQKEIVGLEFDINELNQTIVAWHTHSFYKEKIAREELQFAKEGDEVYYIGTSR